MRKFPFQTECYYHIYNRGVDKRNIFIDEKDYGRFIFDIREMNNSSTYAERLFIKNRSNDNDPKLSSKALELSFNIAGLPHLVDIICYSLPINHFHLLIKQKVDDGIKLFMHKLGTGYTNYFNKKYNRSGALFQGTYEAVQVKTNEQLLYLSAYINGNPEIHKIAKAKSWPWSSYKDYLNLRNGLLCNKQIILSQFKNLDDYKNYVNIVINESGRRKEELKNYLLED